MAVKLIYKDIAPGAKDDISQISVSENNAAIADNSLLGIENNQQVNYVTLENMHWFLDGSFKGIPSDKVIPYWSTQISADESENNQYLFETPIKITRVFANKHTSLGVSFVFDNDAYCNWLDITCYNDNETAAKETFYPDNSTYYCEMNVEVFNKVEIIFYSMSAANRFLKIFAIDDGVNREFVDKDLYSVSILEDMSLISEELPINTLTVSLRRNDDTEYIFQKKQPMYVYHNNKLEGTFFVDDSERTSKDVYDVSAQDYIGVLDLATFYGGIYFDKSAGDIIAEIFKDEKIRYTIDNITAATKLSGHIKICTKREALTQVLFACCSVCDTAGSDKVNIFKISDKISEISSERIFVGGKVSSTNSITSVKIQLHKYSKSAEKTDVFNGDVFAGLNTIEFSNPIVADDTVTISGATLVECYNNYAVVEASAEGEITVSAYEYVDSISTKTMVNENVTLGTVTNQVEISDATLISASNADKVLKHVFEHKMKNSTLESDIVMNNERCGDNVTLHTEWSGDKKGHIEQLEYNLRNKKIGKVVQRISG